MAKNAKRTSSLRRVRNGLNREVKRQAEFMKVVAKDAKAVVMFGKIRLGEEMSLAEANAKMVEVRNQFPSNWKAVHVRIV